jgi:hypothetical protein
MGFEGMGFEGMGFEGIGASVRRKEDFRFLDGKGNCTDSGCCV